MYDRVVMKNNTKSLRVANRPTESFSLAVDLIERAMIEVLAWGCKQELKVPGRLLDYGWLAFATLTSR
jgi:hypothetical protein